MAISPHLLRWHRNLVLAGFALVSAAMAVPAGAATQTSDGTWFESLTKACASTTSCTLTFAVVPAAKTFVAQNVGCRLSAPNNAQVAALDIFGNTGTTYLAVETAPITYTTARVFYLNSEVFVPFKAGQTPRIAFYSSVSGSLNIACSLSGDVKP